MRRESDGSEKMFNLAALQYRAALSTKIVANSAFWGKLRHRLKGC